ncbi:MAG: hypothetical protein IKP69_07435 [Oscillospiraceae bacterium]|nr:hypothetical protein [Oscillospiraceae bacterium]
MVILEGITACFLVLIACVVGIANSPVNLVCLYEKEVQQRVIALGLITEEKIKRNALYFKLFGIIPFFVLVLVSVYGLNGVRGFWEGFVQITGILMIEGLFDRIFIDWYWVGKTKAWTIAGTEDLKPYIYGKTLVFKWLFTIIGYPMIAALLAGIMSFIIK